MSRRALFIAMLVAVGGLLLSGCVEGGYYYDSYDAYPYYDYGYGGPFVYQDVYVRDRHHGRRYYSRRHYDRHGSRHNDWRGSRHDRGGSRHSSRDDHHRSGATHSFRSFNFSSATRGGSHGGRAPGSPLYTH